MTIQIERSIDDPIVTITFEGQLDPDSVRLIDEQAGLLLQEMGTFYAILDIRGTETTFGEILALLESLETAEDRVKFVFVGPGIPHDPTNPSAKPVFENKEQATDYILKHIASMNRN
jgi:hypothetical protein